MRKILFRLAIVSCVLFSYGCALFLIGGGVAGGIAISKDTAKLEVDSSFDHAWDAAYSIVDTRGLITLEDKRGGRIESKIDNSSVVVKIKRITGKAVRISVSARKNLLPNIDLAVEILNKIKEAEE